MANGNVLTTSHISLGSSRTANSDLAKAQRAQEQFARNKQCSSAARNIRAQLKILSQQSAPVAHQDHHSSDRQPESTTVDEVASFSAGPCHTAMVGTTGQGPARKGTEQAGNPKMDASVGNGIRK